MATANQKLSSLRATHNRTFYIDIRIFYERTNLRHQISNKRWTRHFLRLLEIEQ